MNKKTFLLFAAVLLAHSLFAQTVLRTAHYELFAEAAAEQSLASFGREMELRFEEYNRLFRFNPASLPAPLRVRVFQNKDAYDSYVNAQMGNSNAGAVYIHYRSSERRELVIHQESSEASLMIAHQAFIQFLRAFVPNPPTWMMEGFAIYFNSLSFDPLTETMNFEENLTLLESARNFSSVNLGSRSLSPSEILLRDTVQIHDISGMGSISGLYSMEFGISSWALVSFFMNSSQYHRSLTESFMVLSPQLSAVENSMAIMDRLSIWINFSDLDREFRSYLDHRRTFSELMESGVRSFNAGDMTSAEFSFLTAQSQRPSHYRPYYFLGLIYYEKELYDMAEESYMLSLEHGADEALVSFALGLNAIAADDFNNARSWLQRAAAADPIRYRLRVEDLIERLR